jgi:hypothetical protein
MPPSISLAWLIACFGVDLASAVVSFAPRFGKCRCLALRRVTIERGGLLSNDHRNAAIPYGYMDFAVLAAVCTAIKQCLLFRASFVRLILRGANDALVHVGSKRLPVCPPFYGRRLIGNWSRLVSGDWDARLPPLALLGILPGRAAAFSASYA